MNSVTLKIALFRIMTVPISQYFVNKSSKKTRTDNELILPCDLSIFLCDMTLI